MAKYINNLTGKAIVLYPIVFLICLAVFTLLFHQVTAGNNLGSDFYTFWRAGRVVAFEKSNPYADQLSLENQLSVYKRVARPDEDQLGFAYPPQALLIAWPTFGLPYDWAQALWISFNILVLISITYIAFPTARLWFCFTTLLFYPIFFGIILGNFVILIGCLIFLFSYYFLIRKNPPAIFQIAMGIFFAWATVKPQIIWLFLLFFFLTAIRRKNWGVLFSYGINIFIQTALSFLLYPAWVSEWLRRLSQYQQYNHSSPMLIRILNSFSPDYVTGILSITIYTLAFFVTIFFIYSWWHDKATSLATLVWIGFMVFLIHPTVHSYEQIAFLIPFFLWAFQEKSRSVNLVWGAAIGLSWAAFFIGRQISPVLVDALPFGCYALWYLWYFKKNKLSNNIIFPLKI